MTCENVSKFFSHLFFCKSGAPYYKWLEMTDKLWKLIWLKNILIVELASLKYFTFSTLFCKTSNSSG